MDEYYLAFASRSSGNGVSEWVVYMKCDGHQLIIVENG